MYNRFLLFLLVGLFASCATQEQFSIQTIENLEDQLHKSIEDSTASIYIDNGIYKSLAFGEMKVFKPIAFYQLDSVYAIKEKYIENKDWRGLKNSGIEEMIPGYKASAQEVMDEVKYEIEHIYQVKSDETYQINHAYYLFDYENKLTNITPFYDFYIHGEEGLNLFYKYQFNQHFITDRDLYISQEEWDFIYFLKEREYELIKSDELQDYMNHVILLMKIASGINTINFENLAQYVGILKLNELGGEINIRKFDSLYVTTENEQILSYEMTISWSEKDSAEVNRSSITFSPYLEILGIRNKTDEEKNED